MSQFILLQTVLSGIGGEGCIFLVIGIGLCLLIAWYVRNKQQANTEITQQITQITTILNDLARNSHTRLLKISDAATQDDASIVLKSTLLAQERLPDPIRHIEIFKSMLSAPKAPKMLSSVTTRINDVNNQERQGISYFQNYPEIREKAIKAYQQNIIDLTTLYDQLLKLVKGKNLNADAYEWVHGYFNIFEQWVAAGSNKETTVMHEQIIVKLMALNKTHDKSPFTVSTNEKAADCQAILQQLHTLEQQHGQTLRDLKKSYQNASKICNFIAQKITDKPQTEPMKNPLSALPNLQKKQLILIGLIIVAASIVWYLYTQQDVEPLQPPVAGNTIADSTINNDAPTAYAGHSLEIPHPENQTNSHIAHYEIVKKVIDSLHTQAAVPIKSLAQEPLYGIDVSHYQHRIDWHAIGADTSQPQAYHFVIIKATEGIKKDLLFDANWAGANKTADKIGAYHFFTFKDDPVAQAQNYIAHVPLSHGHIRPIVDVERNCDTCADTGRLTKAQMLNNVNIFLKIIEEHYQCRAIIYTGSYYYKRYLKGQFPNNHFWLASYHKDNHPPDIAKAMVAKLGPEAVICWQFSASGTAKGIKGAVDLDFLPGQFSEALLIR